MMYSKQSSKKDILITIIISNLKQNYNESNKRQTDLIMKWKTNVKPL